MFATASLSPIESHGMTGKTRISVERGETLKDARRRASDAEDIINDRLRSGAPPSDAAMEADHMKSSAGIGRMVDMRIPLIWILGGLGSFALFQVMLWFSMQKMTESMVKVEAKMETSSAQTVQALMEINRVKDRVDRVTDDYRSLQQQVQQMQQAQQMARGTR